MKQGPLLIEPRRRSKTNPVAAPKLLMALEPWPQVFVGNLRDLFRPRQKGSLELVSPPAAFWPDVFVAGRLPWAQFLQSGVGHVAVILAVWGWAQIWPQRPQIVPPPVFHHSDVIYYEAPEYLAPLDTGGVRHPEAKKGEPELAAQPIISVPPEADNRSQTIVAPPNVKLNHDVPLPNIVALGQPRPTIPAATMGNAPSDLKLPTLPTSVVAPPPDVRREQRQAPALEASVVAPAPEVKGAISRRDVSPPQPSIVGPPPEAANTTSRRLGDINIGAAPVVAPAPQLPVGEQRAFASVAPAGNGGGAVVPPPPAAQGAGVASNGRLIALNLHPAAPGGPVDVPGGNRSGTFAATPDGKAGAPGTPNIASENRGAGGSGTAGKATNGIPPGLFVGKNSNSNVSSTVAGGSSGGSQPRPSVNSSLLASATPPRVSATPRAAAELPPDVLGEDERKVLGDKKFYAMTLNVPNLNSAGGSWVMHFAELEDGVKQGELIAPVATREVDPGYPLELMRQNVQGTVMLAAVIRNDGSVSDVKILRGIDDRLDEYASAALARWRFRPASRNGDPIALRAVVVIPFHPMRRSGF